MGEMKYVFISHSNVKEDAEFTDELYEFLSENRICCWYDKKIKAGKWEEQIYVHMLPACAYILVESVNSLKSREVGREMDISNQISNMRKSGKIIIPIALDDYIDKQDIAKGSNGYCLGGNCYQTVYLSNYGGDRKKAFGQVLRYLQEMENGPSELKNNAADFEYNEDGTALVKYIGSDEFVEVPVFVEEIADYAFSGNNFVKNVVVPPSVKKIGKCAFYGCRELLSVEGMAGVRDCGADVFENTKFLFDETNNYSLNGIVFGGEVGGDELRLKEGVKVVADKAFYRGKFKTLVIPDGTEVLGAYSFAACTKLTKAVIPKSVKSIKKNAFKDCLNLNEIIFEGSPPYGYEQAFSKKVTEKKFNTEDRENG